MGDFLKQMARTSRERADAVSSSFKDSDFDKPVFPLRLNSFDVIAEIKDRSPSEGDLAVSGRSREEQARQYSAAGACAISVLTEPTRFAGDLFHVKTVSGLVAEAGTPVMRKDFLVDTVQINEARAFGASGVLLIAAMLSDTQLQSMLDCALEHSMFVLLEAFDEDDLRRSTALLEIQRNGHRAAEGQLLVGVNTRNLRTLEVATDRLESLAPLLPKAATCVAESGLRTATDAVRACAMGYRMALVGTALMRADEPGALLADMLAAGRAA